MINKYWWVLRAYIYMRRRIGWASFSMCVSLYETFNEDFTPAEAFEEEFSYWD